MGGIYIHIPFCKQRCKYCAFFSTTLHNMQERYVYAVCNEIKLRHDYIKGPADTVYFGGGTPSVLTTEQITRILEQIKESIGIDDNAEITLEANPDDLSPEYLLQLRTLGINRLSMGVQSFNDKQLSLLNRRHSAQKACEAVENARGAGFTNISIDLMFALPDSNAKEWRHDLEQAIALRPNHISAYNLTYEEGTVLYKEVEKGIIYPLSEDDNLAQFKILINTLKEAGYKHYEISNFALAGYESRHNSSYWHDVPYLGCGAAAHSYDGHSRGWNIADINAYIEGVESGEPNFKVEHLSPAEQYNDAILTRLRTTDGVPVDWIRQKFGDRLTDYMLKNAAPHITAGRLKEQDRSLVLTREGLFVSDAIMRDLIYIE